MIDRPWTREQECGKPTKGGPCVRKTDHPGICQDHCRYVAYPDERIGAGGIKTLRPTLAEIATAEGVPVVLVREAVQNRGVPIKDGRIDRQRLGDVVLEARNLRAA